MAQLLPGTSTDADRSLGVIHRALTTLTRPCPATLTSPRQVSFSRTTSTAACAWLPLCLDRSPATTPCFLSLCLSKPDTKPGLGILCGSSPCSNLLRKHRLLSPANSGFPQVHAPHSGSPSHSAQHASWLSTPLSQYRKFLVWNSVPSSARPQKSWDSAPGPTGCRCQGGGPTSANSSAAPRTWAFAGHARATSPVATRTAAMRHARNAAAVARCETVLCMGVRKERSDDGAASVGSESRGHRSSGSWAPSASSSSSGNRKGRLGVAMVRGR
mmetsp:Transcript_72248/g.233792  ORF Transcript_72248/g.233792 Transcript_72248/m.233792 type:complete len:272 (-) Transcript_72248:58-873(-)